MEENSHLSVAGSHAVIITREQREAGLTPEAVAARLASGAAVPAVVPGLADPSIGQRGITVQMVRQPTARAIVSTTERATVMPRRLDGVEALNAAIEQRTSVHALGPADAGGNTEEVELTTAEALSAFVNPDGQLHPLAVVWVLVDVMGRVVSPARRPLTSAPLGAGGLAPYEVQPLPGTPDSPHAMRSYGQPPGQVTPVAMRAQVRTVARGQGPVRIGGGMLHAYQRGVAMQAPAAGAPVMQPRLTASELEAAVHSLHEAVRALDGAFEQMHKRLTHLEEFVTFLAPPDAPPAEPVAPEPPTE